MVVGADTAATNVEETAFFFPKANPPVTIWAKTREEAEEKLATNKKDHD